MVEPTEYRGYLGWRRMQTGSDVVRSPATCSSRSTVWGSWSGVLTHLDCYFCFLVRDRFYSNLRCLQVRRNSLEERNSRRRLIDAVIDNLAEPLGLIALRNFRMEPFKFALLDETDSGLDIDALRIVGESINRIMRGPDKGVLLITHYERLLEHVRPDRVHVLQAGRITRSGDIELARELEREGYAEAAA